ncbi:MAG: hypothetical protein ACT4OF_05860 [Caulobacteraceae bacterium]
MDRHRTLHTPAILERHTSDTVPKTKQPEPAPEAMPAAAMAPAAEAMPAATEQGAPVEAPAATPGQN